MTRSAALQRRAASIERKIRRLVDIISDDDQGAPAYRRAITEMEAERATVLEELADAEHASAVVAVTRLWTAADVARLLTGLRDELETALDEGRVRELKTALTALVERVEYDPETRQAVIAYRLDTGVNVALPRGRAVAPVRWQRVTIVPKRVA